MMATLLTLIFIGIYKLAGWQVFIVSWFVLLMIVSAHGLATSDDTTKQRN